MNEIKIDGKICSQRSILTQSGKTITTFSLNIYNGKKDGNSVYDFIDCKYFGALDIPNKTIVIITGWIGVESWVKDGETHKKVVIYAKDVEKDTTRATRQEPSNDLLDDDIPFN